MDWVQLLLAVLCFTLGSAESRKHRDVTEYVEEPGFRPLWDDDRSSDFWGETIPEFPEIPKTDQKTFLDSNDLCKTHYCEKGQICEVSQDREPICKCELFCSKHRKLVCSTDGRLFLNHCEFHRTKCIEKSRIHIDRSKSCFGKGLTPITWERIQIEEIFSSSNDLHSVPEQQNIRPIEQFGSPVTTKAPEISTNEMRRGFWPSSDRLIRNCTPQQYKIFKYNLLAFESNRLLMPGKQKGSEEEYLVGLMFSHFDVNNNGNLDGKELLEISKRENMEKLSEGCSLIHLLHFEDVDSDDRLSLNEFYDIFSKSFSVTVVSLKKDLEVNKVSARVGDNLEIKCDVKGTPTPPIIWRRNGMDLAALVSDDIRVFVDGSLYMSELQLIHAGNYTCQADRNADVVQTHILTVYTVPIVQVTPPIQNLHLGQTAYMNCRANGEPFPQVEWLKNDEALDNLDKYVIVGNGTQLQVKDIDYADTGAYMCQAKSIGGMARDISSLVVQEKPIVGMGEESRFFVFHDWGIAVYEAEECRLHHVIQSTDVIPGTEEYVCGDKGKNCTWGRATNVAETYIYVSQPLKDRVLVISIQQLAVVDVITTDQNPVELFYVENLDQVWLVNWRSERNEGVKTLQVIRDASLKKKHHTVHPEPIDGHFDLVENLFVPSPQDLHHDFRYAYVTHTNQRGLYKLDLANMKYIKTVDLTPYNCVPQNIVFSSLHGLVVMECAEPITKRKTGQIIIDYLTDAVLSHNVRMLGQPRVTPDSSLIVTIDEGEKVKIAVQKVTDHGLEYNYDVIASLNVSDVAFFPSQYTHSYDLFASSSDKEDILFLDLQTGKVEMITGIGHAMKSNLNNWGNPSRAISSSGVFGHYMVSPSDSAVFVINGETKTVNCEIGSMIHPRIMVWVTAKYI